MTHMIDQPREHISQQRRAQLEHGLQALDPTHQHILTMKFFERRSTQEIACVLCCSASHVRELQQHALIELQRRIG